MLFYYFIKLTEIIELNQVNYLSLRFLKKKKNVGVPWTYFFMLENFDLTHSITRATYLIQSILKNN